LPAIAVRISLAKAAEERSAPTAGALSGSTGVRNVTKHLGRSSTQRAVKRGKNLRRVSPRPPSG
jgi:hypothetical protein